MTTSNETAHPLPVSDRVGPNPNEGVSTVSHARTWKDNAAEFAALDRGEGWQFAILVACSVEKLGRGKSAIADLKVSAAEFARVAGCSDTRVARYLDAWQEAAAKGWVQDATALTPAMAHDLTLPDHPWRAKDGGVYDASKTGGQISDVGQIAAKAARDPEYAKRVLDQVTVANIEAAQASLHESIAREPRIAGAADQALEDSHKAFMAEHRPIARERSKSQRFLDAISSSRAASHKLKDFADAVAGGEWSDDESAAFNLQVDQLSAALDLIRVGLNSGSWDDELEKLLSGGSL